MAKYLHNHFVIDAKQMKRFFRVETPEGEICGQAEDWLITDINGNQYPIANDLFVHSFKKQRIDIIKEDDRTIVTIFHS